MVSVTDNRRRKVSISILDVLAGGGRTIRRPKKAPVVTPAPIASAAPAAPAPTPTTEDSVVQAAVEVPVATPAAADPAATEASPTETISAWTPLEDAQLLGLKAQNTSWKQIGVLMNGKQGIKERYKELMKDKGENDGAKGRDAKEGEVKKGNEGKEKGKKEGKGKGKQEEKVETNKGEDDGKRPVIYIDEGDELDVHELMFLHRLEEHFEEKKWIEISSKFFDRTGKRVNPIQLREKLG